MQRNVIAVLLATALSGLVGCDQKVDSNAVNVEAAPLVAEVGLFKPTATLQELMLYVIDPNIDPIWNSISTTATAEGIEEKKPETDEDWATLRNHAIALREVSNLLVIEGRKVAAENASTSTHHTELEPHKIEALIAANRPAFIRNAHALHDAATIALQAIEAKNVDALEAAGGIIEHTCEGCHSQFWYPDDKRPTQ